MSLKLLIVAALLLLVLDVDVSSGTFCDEGPPGRYCYKDLSGWYECTIDSKTQQMTETKHDCPINTRCQCFYGPNCPSTVKDPCAKYELPPPFPDVFSTFYTVKITTCNNKACTNVTNIGELLQNATAGEQRHDTVGTSWNTQFIFPFHYIENNDFIQVYYQFDAAWFEKNCSLNSRSIFPRFGVPPYFTCDQSQIRAKMGLNATFKVCLWQSGGHSKNDEVTIERWLLMNLRDGRYIPFSHEVQTKPTPTSNITVYYDTMYPSFFPDFLDPSQLSMPAFCAHGAASFYKNKA
ncbi:uncharacterized protein LOC144657611 isoform X1 [Oculina patagonica]